jgi:arylsulfatase A-like enzyme
MMILKIALLTLAATLLTPAVWAREPNLVFIMVDDLGKAPIGCFNGKAGTAESLTPNIDTLAKGGLKLTNFYSMPQCTPTRAALLTSQYPFRNGWVNHYDVPRWDLKGFAPDRYPNFGATVKKAGYTNCIVGKWQVSDFRDEPDILARCGFDAHCMWTGAEKGVAPSGKRYWDAYLHTKDGSRVYTDKFGPDVCVDYLVDFVRANKDKPFFIYYPMILTHGKLEPPPTSEGKRPKPAAKPAPAKKEKGKRPRARKDPRVKNDNVAYMDALVGRVVKVLDETGVRDNTILTWTTDNGPRKGSTSEDGVCQPFVVNGPGLVSAGVVSDALVDITDIFPTFVELAGGSMPTDKPVDGKSCAPLFLGKAKDSPRTWMMAMGGGGCKRAKADPGESVPGFNVTAYRDRIIRSKTHKLYISRDRNPEKFVRMTATGGESENLLPGLTGKDQAEYERMLKISATFPKKDANPQY